MASGAIPGYGTLLKMGDGAGTAEVFTTIAEVGDIAGPGFSVDTNDVTSHDSTGAMREFKPGLIDPGETSFPIWFQPDAATHDATTGLLSVMNARAIRNWKMIFPNAALSEAAFAAMITKFDVKGPVAGVISADITLKISGPITWTE